MYNISPDIPGNTTIWLSSFVAFEYAKIWSHTACLLTKAQPDMCKIFAVKGYLCLVTLSESPMYQITDQHWKAPYITVQLSSTLLPCHQRKNLIEVMAPNCNIITFCTTVGLAFDSINRTFHPPSIIHCFVKYKNKCQGNMFQKNHVSLFSSNLATHSFIHSCIYSTNLN